MHAGVKVKKGSTRARQGSEYQRVKYTSTRLTDKMQENGTQNEQENGIENQESGINKSETGIQET